MIIHLRHEKNIANPVETMVSWNRSVGSLLMGMAALTVRPLAAGTNETMCSEAPLLKQSTYDANLMVTGPFVAISDILLKAVLL